MPGAHLHIAPRPRVVTHPRLTATLLGGCRITVQGRTVDTVSSRRTRGLLTYLLLHRRAPAPRDVLMDVFWPDAGPAAARNRLHVALTALRHTLREAWPGVVVERRDDTYRLAPDLEIGTDVEEFATAIARARRAEWTGDTATAAAAWELSCGLYAGPLLPGDPYVEWVAPLREQFQLDALTAQRQLLEHYLRRGAVGPAAVLARSVLVLDPADEAAHRALMSCFAGAGQRHLALAQYQVLARRLWRTYRIGPSAETETLHRTLRDPDRGRSVSG